MTFSLTKLLREPASKLQNAPLGRCELCGLPLYDERHGHVVDTLEHRLLCTCYACGLLFDVGESSRARFKAVPKRCVRISSGLLGDAQWDALGIPIGLAFFFQQTGTQHIVAFYPSAAGATESQLPLDAWRDLREREPLISSMQADVEAVVVHRPKGKAARAFIVPIDACYELVGLVRVKWNGIHGGDAVQEAIDAFFAGLAERAT